MQEELQGGNLVFEYISEAHSSLGSSSTTASIRNKGDAWHQCYWLTDSFHLALQWIEIFFINWDCHKQVCGRHIFNVNFKEQAWLIPNTRDSQTFRLNWENKSTQSDNPRRESSGFVMKHSLHCKNFSIPELASLWPEDWKVTFWTIPVSVVTPQWHFRISWL